MKRLDFMILFTIVPVWIVSMAFAIVDFNRFTTGPGFGWKVIFCR